MRSPGSRSDFTAWKALALLMAIAGLLAVVSGSMLAGVGLIVGAGAVYRHAKDIRAGYLHQQKMTGLWQWAQGLGPRKGQGRRRP